MNDIPLEHVTDVTVAFTTLGLDHGNVKKTTLLLKTDYTEEQVKIIDFPPNPR